MISDFQVYNLADSQFYTIQYNTIQYNHDCITDYTRGGFSYKRNFTSLRTEVINKLHWLKLHFSDLWLIGFLIYIAKAQIDILSYTLLP